MGGGRGGAGLVRLNPSPAPSLVRLTRSTEPRIAPSPCRSARESTPCGSGCRGTGGGPPCRRVSGGAARGRGRGDRRDVGDGLIVGADGRPVAPDAAYEPGMFVWFHRELPDEEPVPFALDVLYRDEHVVVADKPHFLATTPRGGHVAETALARLQRGAGPTRRSAPRTGWTASPPGWCCSPCGPSRRLPDAVPRPAGAEESARRWPRTTRGSRCRTLTSRIVKERGVLAAREVARARTPSRRWNSPTTATTWALPPAHTGQTHQLRVHMNALGVPILGDPLYPVVTEPCRPVNSGVRSNCSRGYWSSPIRSRDARTGSWVGASAGPGPRTTSGPRGRDRRWPGSVAPPPAQEALPGAEPAHGFPVSPAGRAMPRVPGRAPQQARPS